MNMTIQISVIIISTLVYLLSPLLVIFFSCLWLYRFFLSLWKAIWHPEFGPLLQGLDSFLINQSPYCGEQLLNVGVYFTVGGRIQLEEFRTVVEKGFDEIRKSDDESSKPNWSIRRFQQVLTTYGGFSVGEDETCFKVSAHVRLLNLDELNERLDRQCKFPESEIKTKANPRLRPRKIILKNKLHQDHFTRDEICELNQTLLRVPFEENKSPWEILLLYNPQSTSSSKSASESESSGQVGADIEKCTTILFLRINHSLADGIAILSLFSHFLDQSQEHAFGRTLDLFSNDSRRKSEQVSHLQLFKINLINFLVGVPEFISYLLKCVQDDWPPKIRDLEQEQELPRPFHTFSYEIPREKIKKIQQSAANSGNSNPKIKSTTIFIAAFASAVEKYFQGQDKGFPSTLPKNVAATFGGFRRRNQMTNNFSIVAVQLPRASNLKQGVETSLLDFLLEIEESYSSTKNSRIRHMSEGLVFLLGLFPLKWKPPFFVLCKGLGISHMPSFENPVTILDTPVLAVQGGASASTSPCIGMFFWEAWDTINGSFLVEKDLLPSRLKAQKLVNCFQKQFDDIYKEINGERKKEPFTLD